jgi:hypothetical protein
MGAKASILRAIVADMPGSPPSGLPPRLDALVRAPPSANDWIREVELWAIQLAVYDTAFAARGGARAFEDWSYRRNRSLLGGPLYKVLFAVLSPERMVVGAAGKYAAFHKGTVMSKLETTSTSFAFKLTTPPYVLPELAQVTLAAAFRAALDLSGAKEVAVTHHVESPEVVAYLTTWKR